MQQTLCQMNFHRAGAVEYLTFPALEALPLIRHAFSTRSGGVSPGVFSSMNLSFGRGDPDENVRENYRRFCRAAGFDPESLVLSAQDHHTVVRAVTRADRGRGITRERGWQGVDGLMTDEPGVTLVTHYADCVPLYFVDPVKRVVALSHAGWRGTVAQMAAVTVGAMERTYGCRAEDLVAAIGPSDLGPVSTWGWQEARSRPETAAMAKYKTFFIILIILMIRTICYQPG